MKKIFAALAVMIGMSSAAHAGILIEPYLGYEMGDFYYKYAGGSTEYKDSLSGVGYGMRLGYKFLLPWVALDYTSGSGTAKRDSAASSTDQDFTRSSLGAVVGVDLPLIRAWAGYGFSNEATLKGVNGGADTKIKGNYLKAGVGLGFIPFVSLNLEYKINEVKKVDLGSGEQDKSAVYDSVKNDTIMVSVSVPFNL